MIFKLSGSWGIASLSPLIWIKSLRSSAHSNQTRTTHNLFVRVFCGIRDAFLFWSSSSSNPPRTFSLLNIHGGWTLSKGCWITKEKVRIMIYRQIRPVLCMALIPSGFDPEIVTYRFQTLKLLQSWSNIYAWVETICEILLQKQQFHAFRSSRFAYSALL